MKRSSKNVKGGVRVFQRCKNEGKLAETVLIPAGITAPTQGCLVAPPNRRLRAGSSRTIDVDKDHVVLCVWEAGHGGVSAGGVLE